MASQDKRRKYKSRWMAAKRTAERMCVGDKADFTDDENSEVECYEPCIVAAGSTSAGTVPISVPANTSDLGSRHTSASEKSVPLVEYLEGYQDDSLSDSDSEQFNDTELAEGLREWVGQYSVKHNAVDSLLRLLSRAGHQLPLCARSLLQTDRHVVTTVKSDMQYLYLGLGKQLQNFVQKLTHDKLVLTTLEISLNVDGLPLFKSSSTCLWPVLCAVVNVTPIYVFTVALCCGTKKPSDLSFLCDVVNELKLFMDTGLTVDGQHFDIWLKCVVCDAPARAMIKAVKLYSGYAGCDKCTQKGKWLGRMTYPEINSELRTDATFRSQTQEEHHSGYSPFCDLPVDMIKQFPIDYMHQCCLGVVRKLILTWMGRGRKGQNLGVRLSAGQIDQISGRLEKLKQHIPAVFARQPRGLYEVDRWKATEFRLFLVYLGKIVLKDILETELYNHFLTFSVAIAILVSPTLSASHAVYAEQLLVYFVQRCSQLYDDEFLVYNVHSMTHLATEAMMFGSLDSCSGFPFENYLQQMKRLVRSGRNPLVQIAKRLGEIKSTKSVELPKSVLISSNVKNNVYIMQNATGCQVLSEDAEQENKLRCRLFRKTRSLFVVPCDSRIIGVFLAETRDAFISSVDSSSLTTRAILIPLDNGSECCFMSILHHI